MYTGTLIRDLLTMVETVERSARVRELAERRELQMLCEAEASLLQCEPELLGAA